MAYSFSAVVTPAIPIGGRARCQVTITETEGAAASEWTVGGLFETWTLTAMDVVKSTGDATTFQPILGGTANPATTQADYVGAVSAAAASIHERTNLRGRGTTLYGRNRPDTGTNNATTTVLVFVEGHI